MTTALMAGSSHWPNASPSSTATCSDRALTGGRSSRTRATGPSRDTSTYSITGPYLDERVGGDSGKIAHPSTASGCDRLDPHAGIHDDHPFSWGEHLHR